MLLSKGRTLAVSVLAILALAAPEAVYARGGGGGGGGGGRAPAGRNGGTGSRSVGGATSAKDKSKKDLESARERLRQADYRGRDSGRDRGTV